MKRFCLTSLWMAASYFLLGQVSVDSTGQLAATKDSFYNLSPVEVRAVRANDRAPVTKTNISKKAIEKQKELTAALQRVNAPTATVEAEPAH